jgi:hypothetical protein
MVESRALGHEDLVDVGAVIGVVQPIFDRDAEPFEEGQRIGDRGADGRDLLLGSLLGAVHLIAVEDDKAAREEAGAAIAFAARFTAASPRSTFFQRMTWVPISPLRTWPPWARHC